MSAAYLGDTGNYHATIVISGSPEGRKFRVNEIDLSRGYITFGGNTYELPRGLSVLEGSAIYAFFSKASPKERLDDCGEPITLLRPSMQLNGLVAFVGAVVDEKISYTPNFPSFGSGDNDTYFYEN